MGNTRPGTWVTLFGHHGRPFTRSCWMSWKVDGLMSIRQEFVSFATQPHANVAGLCRRFQISRKTGYKWLARRRADPADALADRSRRPHASPVKTDAAVEQAVADL